MTGVALVRRTDVFEEVGPGLGARGAAHGLTVRVHARHLVVLRTVAVVVDAIGAQCHGVLDHEAGAGAPAIVVTEVGVAVTVVVDAIVAVVRFVAEGHTDVAVARAAVRRAEVRGVLTWATVHDHVWAFATANESEDGEKTGPK